MAASVTPGKAPQYFTSRGAVTVGKGQGLRFAKGKGYYAGAPVPAPAPNPGAAYGISAAQLRALVAQEVASQVKPQRSAITTAQKQTDSQYAGEMAQINALSKDYASTLGSIGQGVQGVYDNAGNAVAGYARGFGDVLGQQTGAVSAGEQGILQAAGAPASQVADVAGHLALPAAAEYGLGGAIPAGALAREGAGFAAAAKMLPAEALGRGQQIDQGILGSQHTADQQYRDKLSQLLSSVPNLRLAAQDSILKNARADMAEQMIAQKYGLQQRTEVGNLTGVDPATGKPTARAAEAATRAQQAATRAQQAQDTRRTAAVGRRDKATSSLLTKMSTWVYQQRHKQGAVVVGHEPRERTVKDPAGLTVTQFLTPHGWVTATHAPPGTIMKPIYDQHHQIPANYNSMRIYLTRQLTVGLKMYGYKPSDINEMVTELLGPPPAPAPVGDPSLAPVGATHPRP